MGKKKNRDASLTYETLPELFTGICDAIRSKDGTSAQINHQDIPDRISAIPTGAGSAVYVNDATTGDISENFTINEAGTLTVVAIMTYRSSGVTLQKNGTTVSAGISFYNAQSVMSCNRWEFSVAENDVITISSGTGGSSGNNCYVLAVNTPTS